MFFAEQVRLPNQVNLVVVIEGADHRTEKRRRLPVNITFRLPTLAGESIDGGGHGGAQVGAGFQALAVDNFPLQVEDDEVTRGLVRGVNVVVIPSHGASVASRTHGVYSVVAGDEHCMDPFGELL